IGRRPYSGPPTPAGQRHTGPRRVAKAATLTPVPVCAAAGQAATKPVTGRARTFQRGAKLKMPEHRPRVVRTPESFLLGAPSWLVMKFGPCDDLGGEDDGDEPVDGGAEWWPPPCVGDVVAA